MELYLIMAAFICILCIFAGSLSTRIGVPSLLLFIILGMMFGTDGILQIPFSNYGLAESICSVALIFIMFYGGFCTNWEAARPVAKKAVLLSSAGVILTALLTGLFCHFILKTSLLEGLLIGSVLGSTDAASVFSILRMKKLNLVDGMASILEVESGSNDPVAYMLTTIVLGMMAGHSSAGSGAVRYPVRRGSRPGRIEAFKLRTVFFRGNASDSHHGPCSPNLRSLGLSLRQWLLKRLYRRHYPGQQPDKRKSGTRPLF